MPSQKKVILKELCRRSSIAPTKRKKRMRGLERLGRWLGLGTRHSFDATPLSHLDQSHKLLGKHSRAPPRSRPCLSPSRRGLVVSFFLVALSLCLCLLLWCTDVYSQSVLKLVSIRNDLDMIYDLWRFPPTRPFLSVYIFNYTNAEDIGGDRLPRVTEIGPYVFQERTEKINIQFHDNGTVSFVENKTIEYVPEKSYGSLSDSFTLPNIPFLTAISKVVRGSDLVQTAFANILIPVLKVEDFQTITVNDFIWGYEDKFYEWSRKFESFLKGEDVHKFGFLAKRKGVGHHVITVDTGYYDLDHVAQVEDVDGETRIGQWGNTTCDKIQGHEGGLFPGNLIHQKLPQFLYLHDMCRKLPLIYNRTLQSEDGFPVNEYVFPDNIFDYSASNEANSCYKYKREYSPSGTFYSGACKQDAPIYSSFPHFYKADEKLQRSIEGLNPDPVKHSSSFLIHEKLGVTLRAQTKFQLNIRYNEAKFFVRYKGLEDGTILPVAWLHYDSGPLPEHFVNIVYHLTYTTRFVELALKWAFLFLLICSLIWLYRQVKRSHFLFCL